MSHSGRERRLRQRRDFLRLQRSGCRSETRHFIVLDAERFPAAVGEAAPRLGVTVSKRVGNAVMRNRVKRKLRAWFHATEEALPARDYVIIARRGAPRLSLAAIDQELRQVLR